MNLVHTDNSNNNDNNDNNVNDDNNEKSNNNDNSDNNDNNDTRSCTHFIYRLKMADDLYLSINNKIYEN